MVQLIVDKVISYTHFPVYILECNSDCGKLLNGRLDCSLLARFDNYLEAKEAILSKIDESFLGKFINQSNNNLFFHKELIEDLKYFLDQCRDIGDIDSILEWIDDKIILSTHRILVFRGPGSKKIIDFIMKLT